MIKRNNHNPSGSQRYNDEDLAYMRSLAAAIMQRSPRYMLRILILTAILFATLIIWMSQSKLDIVVRGNGKVIPSQQLQVIQSLEGGVVSEILVHEGDQVSANQPLMKISDITFASSFEENRLHILGLKAKISRLEAEANGKPFLERPDPDDRMPEFIDSEKSLYESNQRQLDETLKILEEQAIQKENELVESEAKERQLEKSLSLINQELKIKTPLVKKRLVSEIEYLQLQRQANEIEGQLESIRLSLPRIRSTIEENRRKIVQGRLDFQNKAKKELNDAMAELSRVSEAQAALQDRVRRTMLRAPVNGTVMRLHINTIGGVVQPGNNIIELVPSEDKLLIEAHIKPSDIADIDVGQKARIKFTAYDFAIYGSLEGKVSFISADTVTNDKGESYYIARIRPVQDYLGTKDRPLPIKVGMVSDVDILTGKKTILQYLLKPIYRATENALGET